MNPTITVNAYGNVDALHGIFNAVAMVMGSADFGGIIRIAIAVGFIVALTLMVSPRNYMKGPFWLIGVAVIATVMIAPKATVSIEDRLGLQPPAVVANVPWSLAVIMQVKSAVGYAITNLFDTAFQTIPSASVALPSELSYLNHGVMFGNRLVRQSREASFVSANDQADTVNYLRNCVFPSLASSATPGSFERSTALINELANPNPALQTSWHDATGGMQFGGCAVAWGQIRPKIMAAGNSAVTMLAARAQPGQPPSVSVPAVTGSLEAIYTKAALAGVSSAAQDVMVQNILINATADAAALQSAALADSSMLMLASARTQAVAAMNAGYLTSGRIAEEALPIVRNLTEAILVAVFPLVLAMLIASETGGMVKLFKGYLMTMIWIELWAPMFSVLNWLQTLRSSANLAGAATMDTGAGLSMATATGVYGTAVSDVAVAAWMVSFVPLIAGAVLFGMDRMMSITGTSPGNREADREGGQASKGNLTMGAMSMGQQQVAEFRTDPGMVTTTSAGGTTIRDMVTGTARYQHSMSSGPIGTSDVARIGNERGRLAESSLTRAQTDANAADQATRTAFNSVDEIMRTGAKGTQGGQKWQYLKDADEAATASQTKRSAAELAQKHGVKDVLALEKLLSAEVNGGGSMGTRTMETVGGKNATKPGNIAKTDDIGGKVAALLGVSGSIRDQSALQRDVQEGITFLKNQQTDRRNGMLEKFTNSDDYQNYSKGETSAKQGISANLERSRSYRTTSEASLRESQTLTEQSRKISSIVQDMSINGANQLYDFAASLGYNPHSGNITQEQWGDILYRYAETGQLKRDDNGLEHWVQGNGVNFVQPMPVGEAQLRAAHTASRPMGGEGAVLTQAGKNAGRVRAGQNTAGVSPTMQPNDGGLVQKVEAGQAASKTKIEIGESNQNDRAGDAQDYSDRTFKQAPGARGTWSGMLTRTVDGTPAEDIQANRAHDDRPRPGQDAQSERKANLDAAGKRLDELNRQDAEQRGRNK